MRELGEELENHGGQENWPIFWRKREGGGVSHSKTSVAATQESNLRDDWIVVVAYIPTNRICSTPCSSGIRHVYTPSKPPVVLKRLILEGFLSV